MFVSNSSNYVESDPSIVLLHEIGLRRDIPVDVKIEIKQCLNQSVQGRMLLGENVQADFVVDRNLSSPHHGNAGLLLKKKKKTVGVPKEVKTKIRKHFKENPAHPVSFEGYSDSIRSRGGYDDFGRNGISPRDVISDKNNSSLTK